MFVFVKSVFSLVDVFADETFYLDGVLGGDTNAFSVAANCAVTTDSKSVKASDGM